ncbi:MAG: IS982 family transposase [Candidatus Caldarchaeum sp.]
MTTAEVMTVVLVAAAFYGGKWESARVYLKEHSFIPRMLSKSRLCRRIHAVPPDAWQGVASILAEVHQAADGSDEFLVDSLPIPVCANIRIRRGRLSQGKASHGYIASKQVYFYGLRIHLVCTASGRPVEIAFALGAWRTSGCFGCWCGSCPQEAVLLATGDIFSADEEAVCQEAEQLIFSPLRRGNMKVQHPPWWALYLGYRRRRIETGFSVLCPLLPRSLHAVTARGFELKVYAFVLAYSIKCL